MNNAFEERSEREDDVRTAVNAADDTGMLHQAEIRVEHDVTPIEEDAAHPAPLGGASNG